MTAHGLHIPLHQIPLPGDYHKAPKGYRMSPEELPASAAPSPGAAAAEDQSEERRTRRRRVASVEIPEEIHALSLLSGRDAGAIVEDLMHAQVAALRAKCAALLQEVV